MTLFDPPPQRKLRRDTCFWAVFAVCVLPWIALAVVGIVKTAQP